MSFLFRKYRPTDDDVSQDADEPVEPDVKHELEFRLFPPSPKAQIFLIVGGVVILNVIMLAVVAVGIWMNLR